MQWKKLGRIYTPETRHSWMVSHAANPVAEHVDGDWYRVYFSCRDERNRASIATFIFDVSRPDRGVEISDEPVLSPGEIGTCDDSGVSMGCLVQNGRQRLLYYLCWNLGVTVPWRNSIGLAVSDEPGEPFRRYSHAPIVDRSDTDPFSLSYPWVLKEGTRWRMWYGSNLRWGEHQEEMDHLLKYAESEDGIHWERDGRVAIPFKSKQEYAMSKPCVVRDGDRYRMWYSYRGKAYRIGYAESEDGIVWQRMDESAGIDVSVTGWDSETIEYPCVFDHAGTRYMLYNGNGYGRTGIGLAMLART